MCNSSYRRKRNDGYSIIWSIQLLDAVPRSSGEVDEGNPHLFPERAEYDTGWSQGPDISQCYAQRGAPTVSSSPLGLIKDRAS